MLNRRPYIVAISIAALAFGVHLAAAQTVDDIVTKHIAAIGGREPLSKLTSRRITGTVSGPIEVDSKLPNKSRLYFKLDLTALGAGLLTVERKFDGTKGWTLDSMQGDSEITGSQLESLKNSIFPTPLLNYKANGMSVEVMPSQQLNGKNAIVLKITPKTGPPTTLWLDPDAYLIMKSVAVVAVPEMGGDLEQTSEMSDYRTVDGVKVAFLIKLSNAAQVSTMTVTKVEHNVDLPDSLFIK